MVLLFYMEIKKTHSQSVIDFGHPVETEVKCLNSIVDNSSSDETLGGSIFKQVRDWYTTKRVWAWVMRFVHNCRNGNSKRSGNLSLSQLEKSSSILIGKLILLVQRHVGMINVLMPHWS